MATTTLTITPNFAKKTAKFRGTIAAGEHVAVSIQNDDTYVASATNLRLRVVGPDGKTLAIFPQPVEEGETPETWGNDLTPLTCTLNLNTVQMLKAVPPAATVPLLFVLDDKEADTLYFKDVCEVTHWPQVQGEDEPYNLDEYPDIVAELQEDIATFQSEVNTAIVGIATNVGNAVTKANDAKNLADGANTNASNAVNTANEAKAKVDNVVDGKADLENGKVPDSELPTYINAATYDSQAKKIYLKHGDDVVAEVDATAFIKDGMVSSVEVTGGNLVITFNTDAGKDPVSIPLSSFIQYSDSNPVMDGTASPGSAQTAARSDHVHPHDTAKLDAADVVAPSTASSASGKAADAKATGDALAGKASTADATLTALTGFSPWTIYREGVDVTAQLSSMPQWSNPTPDPNFGYWDISLVHLPGEDVGSTGAGTDENALSLSWHSVLDGGGEQINYTAVRKALSGYRLGPADGPNADKPLASEAEAEELREKKYEKPSGGIPASDLAPGVQTSLGKADTAVQPEAGKGLFSGSYNDLTDKPTIPAAQVNADWNASSGVAQILNKPPLGTAAAKDVPASGNASSSQVVKGDDTRLGDARTPTTHKSTHATGGTDALSPADIGAQPALGYTAENSANKVTSISSSSTDTQYPSAKCVFDIVGNIESALQIINNGSAS